MQTNAAAAMKSKEVKNRLKHSIAQREIFWRLNAKFEQLLDQWILLKAGEITSQATACRYLLIYYNADTVTKNRLRSAIICWAYIVCKCSGVYLSRILRDTDADQENLMGVGTKG